jgi:hypothetical protein
VNTKMREKEMIRIFVDEGNKEYNSIVINRGI